MEYKNLMHVPHLTETGFGTSGYLCPQSHNFPGHSRIPVEDNAVAWNISVASSSSLGSNGACTISSYPDIQSYSTGMPHGSFLHSSAVVSNPVVQSLHQASISASTYGTHQAEYQNNFGINNGGELLKRKRFLIPVLEMVNPLRYHSRDHSLELPIYDDAYHWEELTSALRYCPSGYRDEARFAYGQRTVTRQVGPGFSHENSSGSSMHRFYSAGHYLGELHDQLSDVSRATAMESLRLAHESNRRVLNPVNISLNREAHHLPSVSRNSSNTGGANEHNYTFTRNSVVHLQNPHVTPIESTRRGRRGLFQWDVAAQRSALSHQFHQRPRSVANAISYGSQSGVQPHVSTSRFPRRLSLIPERSRGRWNRTNTRRSFGGSAVATAHATLFPEGATVLDSYYRSEFFIDNHRDMRLDVDNMSYEELLSLEEEIGDVCTGLSEKTISKRLKKKILVTSDKAEERLEKDSICTICQEEYTNKDRLGTLDCGHNYHYNCIKQWLLLKNVCPSCKATALGNGPDR